MYEYEDAILASDNLQDLDNKIRQAENQLDKTFEKIIQEEKQKVKRAMELACPRQRILIQKACMDIAKEDFNKVFNAKFGKDNYDKVILENCIKINFNNFNEPLTPELSYNPENFIVKINEAQEKRKFNPRIGKKSLYDSLDFEPLDTFEIEDFYGTLSDTETIEDLYEDFINENDSSNEDDFIVNKRAGISEIKEVFQQAYSIAIIDIEKACRPGTPLNNQVTSIYGSILHDLQRRNK